MKARRFIISTICATVFAFGLLLVLIFYFPDQVNQTHSLPTFGHELLRAACLIVLWPFAIVLLILHRDPPLLMGVLLLLVTGLFWGVMVELVFILKSRLKKHCCIKMSEAATTTCGQHPDRFDCPDALIHYDSSTHGYGIIVHDGGRSAIVIFYCPWCGAKLRRRIEPAKPAKLKT
jgi:hypothetical protein